MFIPRPADVCYLCAQHRMGGEYEGKPTDDYGVNIAELVDERGDLRAVPALYWNISAVASDMADLIIDYLEGGEIPAQVLVRANSWEPILNIPQGKKLKTVAAFIASQASLGLIPNLKLSKLNKGYQLLAQRSVFALELKQSDRCPLHSTQLSAEDI